MHFYALVRVPQLPNILEDPWIDRKTMFLFCPKMDSKLPSSDSFPSQFTVLMNVSVCVLYTQAGYLSASNLQMLAQWTEVLWNWYTGQNVDLISHFCVLHPWAVFWSHCCCMKSVISDHVQNLYFVLTLPILIVQDLILFCINMGAMPILLSFPSFGSFTNMRKNYIWDFYTPLTSWNLLEGVQIGPWVSAGALDHHLFQLCFLISQSLYSSC